MTMSGVCLCVCGVIVWRGVIVCVGVCVCGLMVFALYCVQYNLFVVCAVRVVTVVCGLWQVVNGVCGVCGMCCVRDDCVVCGTWCAVCGSEW